MNVVTWFGIGTIALGIIFTIVGWRTEVYFDAQFKDKWVGAMVMAPNREARVVVTANRKTNTLTFDQPFSDPPEIWQLKIISPPLSEWE